MSIEDAGQPIPLPSRLPIRFAVALCIGAAVILGAAGMWNVHLQREHLNRLLAIGASGSADIVRQATRDAMLRNDPDEVHEVLARIGAQRGIERIRIFDKQGRIITSTLSTEAGRFVDRDAEECVACHRTATPESDLDMSERIRVFRAADGRQIMGVTSVIRNEPDCSGAPCHIHDVDQELLGILDVHLTYAPVETHIAASEQQMAITLVLTTVALLLVAGGLTWRLVLRPVQRLTEATRRVASGDLSVHETEPASGELGRLVASWNTMVAELRAISDERDRWTGELETRVRQKTDELTEAHRQMLDVERMASLGRLAAVVAHELNNPLAGIVTYARLLRRRLERAGSPNEEGDEPARILALVESEAARCGDIVRNLLLFSRAPGARFVETDVESVLRRCVMLIQHQADLQEVQIDVAVGAGLTPFVADTAQVQQSVLALCLNALEAMPDGGLLRLTADGQRGHVRIVVSDDGCGIDQQDLARIFEPFVSTKEHGHGVGLGLAVVHGITRRHGGEVRVDSAVGGGATFTLRFPREPPDVGADPEDGSSAATPLEEVLG